MLLTEEEEEEEEELLELLELLSTLSRVLALEPPRGVSDTESRPPVLNTEGKAGTGEMGCLEAGLGLGDSVILFLALCVGEGTLGGGGDLEAVTGALLGSVTEPPREKDLREEVATLGTVGTDRAGSLGVTGSEGTAGTGVSSLTEVTGSEGTAATGSGRTFCTGEMREAERGDSWRTPREAGSGSSWPLKAVKEDWARAGRATGSRPS